MSATENPGVANSEDLYGLGIKRLQHDIEFTLLQLWKTT